jgi:acetyl esterase/lipase
MRNPPWLLLFALATSSGQPCPDAPRPAPFAMRGVPRYLEPVFSKIAIQRDVVYRETVNDQGKKEALTLDIYEPEGDTAKVRPAFVNIHGGSLRWMDKDNARSVQLSRDLARRGYVVLNINYRLRTDESRSLLRTLVEAIQDVAAAVEWARKNRESMRIHPDYIAIGGESAGGQITSNYMTLDNLAEAPRGRQGIFASVVLYGPPAHPAIPEIKPVLDGCNPPTVVLHGTDDLTIASGMKYANQLHELGVFTRLQMVEDGNHGLTGKEDEFMPVIATFLYDVLTTGGKPQSSYRYEAETYSRKLSSEFSKAVAGFTGTGALRLGGGQGYVEWGHVDVPAAGEYRLSLRYLNQADAARPYDLRVNGAVVGRVAFAPSAPGAAWSAESVKVSLKAGRNAIRLTATSAGAGPLLDRMDVDPN